MRKLLIFMTSFFLAAILTFADKQEKVTLNNGNRQTLSFGGCNVFVTRTSIDDDGNAKVTVAIENTDDSNVLILFDRAYSEKNLKKLSPPTTFDKGFPGTKGQRNVDTYKEAKNMLRIGPGETKNLSEISVEGAKTQLCRLPLYIGKYKDRKFLGTRKKKLLLMEEVILELEIEVEYKPKTDEDFVRLEKECNDLIEEISKQTFCTNSRHKMSLKEQKAPYKDRISRIISEIDRILANHKEWMSSDKEYQRYEGIKEKLFKDRSNNEDILSDYEGDCGNHRTNLPRRHTCKYCNLSLQQIYHKLDDYYKKIYNSSNRKATKDAVMTDVNLLYRCCTDVNCTKHSSWSSSEYKSKITDRYTRICNF